MFVAAQSVEKTDRFGRKFSHDLFHLKCDVCGHEWDQRGAKSRLLKTFHVCSNTCKKDANKKGGVISNARAQTCVERFGTEMPFNRPESREQQRKTMIERYGVEFPMQMPSVQEAMKRGCNEKLGVDYPLQNCDVFKKAQRSRSIRTVYSHWKSQEELVCIGSYERAFVEWCNNHQIDFDWQISHRMPDGRTYIVDAFIKTGEFANTWVEIKGWLTETAKEKWEWFHSEHSNSQMWTKTCLEEKGIL